ncbi:hypothetical protein [Tepidibacter formicigenes]|jgi:hypothetical protein|uniref:Uncharacterized protein n=1 Tax=Tepidibacter formicigenes DSM 15518 TaxID=1123349 RepID=A0A1M6SNE7_9FIRM|nr:hypothetical protein [Tepidibacter formicigenes]SHK46166.1 hypothetical protein SAMN02744037_02388 [Tepidibacter formicigenes DSM 15518]
MKIIKMKINNLEEFKQLVEKTNMQLKEVNENLEKINSFKLDIEFQK